MQDEIAETHFGNFESYLHFLTPAMLILNYSLPFDSHFWDKYFDYS